MRQLLSCFAIFIAIVILQSTAPAEDWPRFRGPNGAGVAPPLDIPNEWRESDYAWQVALPGSGHGSPVVWGEQVFVTSGDAGAGEIHLDAYHAASGKLAWRKSLAAKSFQKHLLNSHASSTPAADDQHVYVSYFSTQQVMLVAFTQLGEEVWRRELGGFSSQHGFASSPIVAAGLVCLQGETSEGGYLTALDAATGETRWKSPRPAGKESYSTPATIELSDGGEAIVVVSQTAGVELLDPASGDVLWQTDALPARTVGSPVVAGDLILATCGSGGGGQEMLAIRANAAGDKRVAYTLTKNVPYVPTPVVVGELLFLWHDRGTVTCAELSTGKELWTKRVGGKYFGSPIAIGDRILAMSTEGQTVMLAASRDYQLLGTTDLGEPTHATPAAANGRLYLRTESKLFCLEE